MGPAGWTDVEELAHSNIPPAFWSLVGGRRNAVQERWPEHGGAFVLRQDVPARISNFLFAPHPPQDPEEIGRLLDRAELFFGPRYWRVITTTAANARLGPVAQARGMTRARGDPGMILSPIPPPPEPPAGLSIVEVTDRQRMRDWHRVVGRAFGIPQFAARKVFPVEPPKDTPERRTRFFVGYKDGVPVGSAGSVVTGRIAGITTIGAEKLVRGGGIGTAMTWRAAAEGRAAGADVAFLEATEMGEPVYRRMGFVKGEDYPEWHSAPTPGSRRWAFAMVLSLLFTSR